MRKFLMVCLVFGVVFAITAGAQETPAEPKVSESVEFIQALVVKMDSKNARLRFAVREALLVMGKQALPALNENKANVKNEHLKGFVNRTIARIKSMKTMAGRSFSTLRGRDLDRMAMQCNLTLEQITQIQPLLAKHDKNVKELWAEFREGGGYQDREAYKDLREELKLLAEESEPALRKYLNAAQAASVAKQLQGGRGGGQIGMISGPGGAFKVKRVGGGGGGGK